jgi:hypothetical protein
MLTDPRSSILSGTSTDRGVYNRATTKFLSQTSMPKWFNTVGPCKADIHYTLPSPERLPELKQLIAQQNYFVIHAPRQTGKTSAMLFLAQERTAEVGSVFPDQPDLAEGVILSAWRDGIDFWLLPELEPLSWPEVSHGQSIGAFLKAWAQSLPRPLVVFIDEIDSLQIKLLGLLLQMI